VSLCKTSLRAPDVDNLPEISFFLFIFKEKAREKNHLKGKKSSKEYKLRINLS
jgi:hypothetical protein